MCNIVTAAACTYLAALTTLPGVLVHSHVATELALHTNAGDETSHIYLFTHLTSYVRNFVEIADGLATGDIQGVPCQNIEGVRPNQKLIRQGVEKVIVEIKSVAAFNTHAGAIQKMARANRGSGTEIIYQGHKANARSSILKVSIEYVPIHPVPSVHT